MFGAPFPGLPAAVATFLDKQAIAAIIPSGVAIFTGLNFGANKGQYMAVAFSSGAVLSQAKIGGVVANILVVATSSTLRLGIAVAFVPSGSPTTVELDFTGSVAFPNIALYSIAGISAPTAFAVATSTASSAPTATLNIPQNSCVIAVASKIIVSGGTSGVTWTGLIVDCDDVITAGFERSSASQNFAPPQPGHAMTCTFASAAANIPPGAFAVFSP